ncbi:hypothetical protein ACFU5Y_33320, partial [Streptomyces gardneri]
LRQFFRFARSQHIVLVDPTRNLTVKESNGSRGRTITLDPQRGLFRRWTTDEHVHPHEALAGMLALLHGASSSEVPMLQITNVDQIAQTVRLGKRLHSVPLECGDHRFNQRPLVVGQVGLVGLALAHGVQPSPPELCYRLDCRSHTQSGDDKSSGRLTRSTAR